MKISLREHFETKYIPEPNSGCWLWLTAISPSGYGRFYNRERGVFAHRFSWEIYIGSIPDKLCVLHHCDTPSCVNPTHLFLGSQADNIADMVAKKRNNGNGNENKTHCPVGHRYTPENTYYSQNKRSCKICVKKRSITRYYNKVRGDKK